MIFSFEEFTHAIKAGFDQHAIGRTELFAGFGDVDKDVKQMDIKHMETYQSMSAALENNRKSMKAEARALVEQE